MFLVAGSYSERGENALFLYHYYPETGGMERILEFPVSNVSYLTISQKGVIYAITEEDTESSLLTAIRLDTSKRDYEIINRRHINSNSPCYAALSPDEKYIATANYGDGSITVFPIEKDGGTGECVKRVRFRGSGPFLPRQANSHAHCISFTPDGRFMLVTDLGSDRIHIFSISSDALDFISDTPDSEIVLKSGTGPRHIIFNNSGDIAYLVGEVSDEAVVLGYNEGHFEILQYIKPEMAGGHGAADIHLSKDGKKLYTSLRLQNDGISTFNVKSDGCLDYVSHTPTGKHPRNFILTPDGKQMLVATRDSNLIEVFNISDVQLTKQSETEQKRVVFLRFL